MHKHLNTLNENNRKFILQELEPVPVVIGRAHLDRSPVCQRTNTETDIRVTNLFKINVSLLQLYVWTCVSVLTVHLSGTCSSLLVNFKQTSQKADVAGSVVWFKYDTFGQGLIWCIASLQSYVFSPHLNKKYWYIQITASADAAWLNPKCSAHRDTEVPFKV